MRVALALRVENANVLADIWSGDHQLCERFSSCDLVAADWTSCSTLQPEHKQKLWKAGASNHKLLHNSLFSS